jgi:hypothetical protein
MWVLPAESPLALGPLYVRNPFQRKGKVEIHREIGGNLKSPLSGKPEKRGPGSSTTCVLKKQERKD